MLMIYFLFTFASTIIYSMHISLAYMYILLLFVLNQENRLIVIQHCQHSQKMKCYINTICIIQIGKQLYFPSILAGLIFFFFWKTFTKSSLLLCFLLLETGFYPLKYSKPHSGPLLFFTSQKANKAVFSKLSAAVQIFVFRSFVVAVTVMTAHRSLEAQLLI